jgi:pSer/pThr/pTyr-binding forkhead associated (FHA) protein/uncharacterized RDD family membrane protein YckC
VSQLTQTGWQIFVEVPGKAPIELPNGESVIGRSRACAVQIAETTVSRQHAIFVVEPGKVKLRDLGSSNGTFVNGQRVDGEMPLTDGDRVVVGEAELVLRVLAPLGPAEATARLVIPPLTQAPLASPVGNDADLNLPLDRPFAPASAAWQPPAASASPAWQPPAPQAPAPGAASAALLGEAFASPAASPLRDDPPPVSGLSPTPIPPPRPVPAIAPPPALTPPPMPVPRMPTASAPARADGAAPADPFAPSAPAGSLEKKDGEMLSSIRDIDLAPVPPPVAQPRKVTVIDKAEPAGFWLRVVASLLDTIPLALLAGLPIFVQVFISPSIGSLLFVLAPLYSLFVYLVLPATWGTTPGKRLMKLAIVSESTGPGQGLGWGTAALRLVGYLVCSFTAGLGYLLVAFSARKQGLHDLIAKTNVVRKR